MASHNITNIFAWNTTGGTVNTPVLALGGLMGPVINGFVLEAILSWYSAGAIAVPNQIIVSLGSAAGPLDVVAQCSGIAAAAGIVPINLRAAGVMGGMLILPTHTNVWVTAVHGSIVTIAVNLVCLRPA